MTPNLPLHTIANEARVLDTDLASRLGMKNVRNIRPDLIEPHMTELRSYGELQAVTADTGKPGPKPKAFYLNEEQALLVCMFSKTEKAAAVRKQVIETFMAYRRGQLVVAAQPAIPTTFAEALRLAADEAEKRQIAETALLDAQPKIAVADNIERHRRTVTDYARTFKGVNLSKVKEDLEWAGYLYRPRGGHYRVYAKYRDNGTFSENLNEGFGTSTIYCGPRGYEVIAQLYAAGKLTMKKGFKAL